MNTPLCTVLYVSQVYNCSFKLFIYFCLMYMSVLHVCLCTMYVSDTFSGQKVLDPLELEVQRVLRFHVG